MTLSFLRRPGPGHRSPRAGAFERGGPAPRRPSTARRASIVPAAPLLVLALAACEPEPPARVVSAVFRDDKTPDEVSQAGETFLLRLDRPLPEGFDVEDVSVNLLPPAESWLARAELSGSDPRELEVEVVTGRRPLVLEGVYGRDAGASGLLIDWGAGASQEVDLQPHRRVPELVACVWEDAPPGNLVVDEGDRLRLIFDGPVELAEGAGGERVRVPREVLLSRDGIDRLDDGERPATWASAAEEDEVAIVLGSNPFLTIHGDLPEDPRELDRFGLDAPTGIALWGTAILPMSRIVSRGGGPGARSTREVDIAYPAGLPRSDPRPDESFPPPGDRSLHTATRFAGFYAVIAGGLARTTSEALDDLLVYNLFHRGPGLRPFQKLDQSLPSPAYRHTATLLPGAGDNPLEDHLVLAGGFDGEAALGDITLVRIREGFEVVTLETTLRVPRWGHATAAVGPRSILVDGGSTIGPDGEERLVGSAELLTFELPRDGGKPGVASHRVFRSLPRTGHTLTALGASGGRRLALAYGGFGHSANQARSILSPGGGLGRPVPEDAAAGLLEARDEARVLVSPILWDVERPEASIVLVPPGRDYALLRHRHRAVALGAPAVGDPASPDSVLIVAGTLGHPVHGFEGSLDTLWEIDLAPDELPALTRRPEPQDALNAVLFLFDPSAPEESRFEVVPHPAPDPSRMPVRLECTATAVPGLGAVIAGGTTGEAATASVEVFLSERRELVPYALRLASPRAAHAAIHFEEESSLLLIGGRTGTEKGEEKIPLADVEALPLPE